MKNPLKISASIDGKKILRDGTRGRGKKIKFKKSIKIPKERTRMDGLLSL
jgi:hypothetical protein